MIAYVRHRLRVAGGALHEAEKIARLPEGWSDVAREHLKRKPECFACKGKTNLHVHHVVDDPARVFEPSNLVTLCMGERECHLLIGHGGDWNRRNPIVFASAGSARMYPDDYEHFVRQARRESMK